MQPVETPGIYGRSIIRLGEKSFNSTFHMITTNIVHGSVLVGSSYAGQVAAGWLSIQLFHDAAARISLDDMRCKSY